VDCKARAIDASEFDRVAILTQPTLVILVARFDSSDIDNDDVQRKHLNVREEYGERHQIACAIAPDAWLGRDVRDDLMN
jgi:hypothetical protein